MTDQDNIRWACEWVGWPYCGGRPSDWAEDKSIPDLAEAVRTKFIEMDCAYAIRYAYAPSVFSQVALEAFAEWGEHGPLAFIAAVREVVDG